jgi:Fe-S-cluster containining protein
MSKQDKMNPQQTECRQCGACCRNGGPALHMDDLPLIKSGKLPMDKLITIRRGELVNHPLTGKLQTVGYELIKITGMERDWRCVYYSDNLGCTIYALRPSACRALKCWDTADISELIGKDTLTRLDILEAGDRLRMSVEEQERLCPCPDMGLLRLSVVDGSPVNLAALQELVDTDLSIRIRVVREQHLSLAQELFVFGRPIFQLLHAVGVGITEIAGRVRLFSKAGASGQEKR